MTIIQVEILDNFVILPRQILENPEISLKTKGFFAFCMAKPKSWNFHVRQLASSLKEGRDVIYGCIKELIAWGYCTKIQKQGEGGRFDSVDYIMSPYSKLKEKIHDLKESLPLTCFPYPENPCPENPPLVSNTKSNNDLEKQSSSPTPSKTEPLPVKPEKEVVVEEKIDPIEEKERIVENALYSSLDGVTAGAGMVWFVNNKEAILRACKKNLGGYVLAMVRKGAHLNPDAFSKPSSSANIELAKKIADKHGEKHNIIAEQQGLAFNFATGSVIFEYTDPEFEKQVLARLTAMKIVI